MCYADGILLTEKHSCITKVQRMLSLTQSRRCLYVYSPRTKYNGVDKD